MRRCCQVVVVVSVVRVVRVVVVVIVVIVVRVVVVVSVVRVVIWEDGREKEPRITTFVCSRSYFFA